MLNTVQTLPLTHHRTYNYENNHENNHENNYENNHENNNANLIMSITDRLVRSVRDSLILVKHNLIISITIKNLLITLI